MDHISQREVSYIEKRARKTIGGVTLSPINDRERVGTTTFDTFYDFIKYVDGNDLWTSLFKFESKLANAQFVRVFKWKNNALRLIKKYCSESNIIINERYILDLDQKLTRFSKTFKNLNVLISNDFDRKKLDPIHSRIIKCVKDSSQSRTIFNIKPNQSKEFIDIIYDGIFTGKSILTYVDNDYDTYISIDNAISERNDTIRDDYTDYDDVPPLSSSSNSSSSESVLDSEDEEVSSIRKKSRSNKSSQEDVEFDINQVIPESSTTTLVSPPKKDILDSIKDLKDFDIELVREMKVKDAIAISFNITTLLQDIFTKNADVFCNFITDLNYNNYQFCLIQIEKSFRTSKRLIAFSLITSLVRAMQKDVMNIKTIPRSFFSYGYRKQYADLMQEMFDILNFILL